MTQTAHIAAREAVYQILREALRLGLELRSRTLRSRAELPHERIHESLIPPGKSRNSSAAASPWIPPTPVCRARRSPPSGAGFHTRCVTFPRASRAPARCLFRARARWGVRLCTDSGLSPPTLEGHFRMTNRRRTWETGFPDIRGQGRAIQQQGHSASPRLLADVQQELREREQRALQSALAAPQGGVPTMALAQHCHRPWRHPGSDGHRSVTPPPCFPRPCCAAPPVRKRLSLELSLLRSPSCSAAAPSWASTRGRTTCRRSLAVRIHLRRPRHTPVLQAKRAASWPSTA